MRRAGWTTVGRLALLFLCVGCAAGATQESGEKDSGTSGAVQGGTGGPRTGGQGATGGNAANMAPASTGAFGNAPTPPAPMPTDAGMMSTADASADAASDAGGGGGGTSGGGVGGDVSDCTDKAKNGAETDVDCGGGDCPKCAAMDTCVEDGDCESDLCGTTNTCCEPKKVADCTSMQCGAVADGCGGTITCPNNCPGGSCSGGTCCMARSVASCAADECGSTPNGCGGTINCPNNCAGDEICASGHCQMVCDVLTCPSCGIGNVIYQRCCRSNNECGCEWTVFGGCS